MSKQNGARLLLTGVLGLGAIMTLLGSPVNVPALPSVSYSENQSLTAAEQAYLAFIVPRLDRLIEEVTEVSTLVDRHSRNIIALRSHGNRITALTREIIEWDDENAAPVSFLARHESLIATVGELQRLIDDAQRAFARLDFDRITAMVPRFNSAATATQTIRNTLPPAGDSLS